MEVALYRYGKGPELARVVKRLWDKYDIPIVTANDDPILDSLIYEVEYQDGHQASLAANAITKNLSAQVDDEGYRLVLLQDIVHLVWTGREVTKENDFIISHNGGQRRKETTQGWEILIEWKDIFTTWESLKDVK